MKTAEQNIKLNENNRIMQEFAKTETKKYTSEVKKIASKYISELQKDILKQRNFNIFDETYEKTGEDTKAVYYWFIKGYDNILNNMNIGVQQILNIFNKTNNIKLSLVDLVKPDNEIVDFMISEKLSGAFTNEAYSIIEEMYSYNAIWFDGFYMINFIFFSFFIYYICIKLEIIKEAVIEKKGKNTKKIIALVDDLLNHTLIQADSLNAALHEYQIICFGQHFADLIFYKSFNQEYISQLFENEKYININRYKTNNNFRRRV